MLQIEENFSLKDLTTFKIGGVAKYFTKVKSLEELKEAMDFVKKKNLPFFVLGGGSKTLFLDEGFKGLVIKIQNSKISIKGSKIFVEAGCLLQDLVSFAKENSLSGLEFLAGIPGTVGGAVFGNAGAFGKSIGDFVERVKAIDIGDFKEKILEKKDCNFGYRSSVFKETKKHIIWEVELLLEKRKKEEIEMKMKENLAWRKENQPLEFPSAGSIFKNVFLGELSEKAKKILLPNEDFEKKGYIPAAYLIEMAGLKGKTIGRAQVSQKHSNFIVNLGGARAEDVIILISLIKQKVRNKFNVLLEEELNIVGV